ncbi:ribonuclease HII [Sporosarcina highlanderae]|uniref:Ribonuclease HII n=1 Tax=Sporosarcina highlanderae TaxID=3035916 RepID=A0ABT8JQP5_9BACL|nr:ribonuclease HII [Sporosarcina highlanderae]MDN4607481.1 ribonuclease HII [Sporosarcina highlanderae]
MKTIKEISERLKSTELPERWMKELESDQRVGVKRELERWYRNFEKKQQLKKMLLDKIAFDGSYKISGEELVAGVDEAGRGPLAGPVVCAAVILPDNVDCLLGLDDSKKTSRQERNRLAGLIKQVAVSYSVHIQSAERIDAVNIYAATRESMETAVNNLSVYPSIVLADAMALKVNCRAESIIKGDAQSLAIAAASILAKTTRDDLMDELDACYPMYQFKKNAGYGTAEHVEALRIHGPCKHHRKTFEPVKSMLEGVMER